MSVVAAPLLIPLCDLEVEVGSPFEVGETPFGRRRLVPITGGRASGRLSGRVLPGGLDVQLVAQDRIARLEARYLMELDDGARVFVQNDALRVATAEVSGMLMRGEPVPPEAVYFRGHVRLESPAPAWSWLDERLFVGAGVRRPDRVLLSLFELA